MTLTDEQKKAALEARRKYHRQWRRENKDKVRQYNDSYWFRKAQQSGNSEG